MSEAALPFALVLADTTEKIGMGRITGVAIMLVGIYSGYTPGSLNPLNTVIGQQIAQLPVFWDCI